MSTRTAETAKLPASVRLDSFRFLLILGVLLRLVALNGPLIDAHLVRQTQTADWTYHAAQEQGWPLSAEVSWRGNTQARLTLEFPIYNYLVIGVWRLLGDLDMAGKVVSISLWLGSFALLQGIWRRLLDARQTFWSNVLFVLSPLSVFFGQAFMPEMCVQFLAISLLHQLLRYQEKPSMKCYSLFVLAGLAGLLVKPLEISHLYVVAFLVFFRRDGVKMFLRRRHWVGGAITLVAYLAWANYVNQVNEPSFPAWTASVLSQDFLGGWRQRLDWYFYFKVTAYLAAFASGPVGLLIAGLGFVRRTRENRFGFWWAYSLVFFYLVWGLKTAGLHSYYNLPALGPLCFLFGLGMPTVLERLDRAVGHSAAFKKVGLGVLALLVFGPLVGGSLYLFRRDFTIYEAALWVKAHSQETDLVILHVNHRPDNDAYPEDPVFSYYAKRNTWIDTVRMKESEREQALETSTWAVLTRPSNQSTWAEKARDRIRGYAPLKEMADWPKPGLGFVRAHSDNRFVIFRKERSNQTASQTYAR